MLTFQILDQKVSKENQVFDHLVKVRRLDTGEEGLLLCSHCCRWPKELIPQATWLEGCFTPEDYKEDPRLLMGYHPNHLTSWDIDWEEKTVSLTLTEFTRETLVFPIPFQSLMTCTPLFKRVDRYLSKVDGEYWEDYLENLFSAVVAIYSKTKDISLILAAPAWINSRPDCPNIHFIEGEWAKSILYPYLDKGWDSGYELSEHGFLIEPLRYW